MQNKKKYTYYIPTYNKYYLCLLIKSYPFFIIYGCFHVRVIYEDFQLCLLSFYQRICKIFEQQNRYTRLYTSISENVQIVNYASQRLLHLQKLKFSPRQARRELGAHCCFSVFFIRGSLLVPGLKIGILVNGHLSGQPSQATQRGHNGSAIKNVWGIK